MFSSFASGVLESFNDIGIAGPAIFRFVGHHAVDSLAGGGAYPVGDFCEARNGLFCTTQNLVRCGRCLEGRATSEGMIECRSEGINIAAEILVAAFKGFWWGVERGGPDFFGLCAATLGNEGEPEVEEFGMTVFIDEDVSGGATAYMMDQVLNAQKGYFHLDAQPVTLTAKDHRPAYGSDGDYFSKPSIDDIIENILTDLILEK